MLFFHRNEDATFRLMKLQDDEDAEKQFNEHFIHENRVKIADHECRKNIYVSSHSLNLSSIDCQSGKNLFDFAKSGLKQLKLYEEWTLIKLYFIASSHTQKSPCRFDNSRLPLICKGDFESPCNTSNILYQHFRSQTNKKKSRDAFP